MFIRQSELMKRRHGGESVHPGGFYKNKAKARVWYQMVPLQLRLRGNRKNAVTSQMVRSLSIIMSIMLCQSIQIGAFAAEDDAASLQQSSRAVETAQNSSKDQQTISNKPDTGLNGDDINDVGYALQRIRQQAINIYIEAIRKQNSTEVSAELPALNKVPAEVPKNMNNLLPFRRPWLVYFLTTLEPLVHLLKQDVKDIENGNKNLNISAETRQAINPLIDEWTAGVKNLDEHLTATMALVEDADKNNVELAKIAISIDEDVAKLEHVRDKAFRIVDAMEKTKRSAPKTGNAEHHSNRVTVGL